METKTGDIRENVPIIKAIPVEAEKDIFEHIETLLAGALLNTTTTSVMRKRFLTAYRQPNEKYIVAIQYYDEQQQRCTMFVDTCGNELAAETLVELIKISVKH